MVRRTCALLFVLMAVGGCSGSGDARQVRESFARYVAALERRDVAGACDGMTAAFFRALAGEVNTNLAVARQSVSTGNCRAGLRSLFALAGRGSLVRSGVSITDVVVHGTSATARERDPGGQPRTIRFIEQGGKWRLDCCVGRQVEQQPQATYRIPSPSMMPTLHVGQLVVSDNAALRRHPPALGAIVVFHPPGGADSPNPQCGAPREGAGFPRPCGEPTAGESGQTFIKRVVGLPGDHVAMVNGRVIRNGSAEALTYRVEPCTGSPACNFSQPITVPAGEYFVLGDNLSDSDDSRYWGPVKRSWLIGIVRAG